MTKLVTLYTRPDDLAEFDRRYQQDYLPLVRELPGVQRLDVARIIGAPLGGAPYHLLEELHFANEATMYAARSSEQWRAAQAAMAFARGLATTMFAEEVREHA